MFPRPDPSVSEDLPAVLAVRLALHVLSVLSAVVFPRPPLGYVNNEGREFRDLVAVRRHHLAQGHDNELGPRLARKRPRYGT